MNFLNQQEQNKVRQLLAAYEEKEMRENGCQTESNICKCQEAVVQRLEKLEQNVEKILMFMEWRHEEKVSVPENQGDESLFNSDPIYASSNDSIEDFGHLLSLGEISNVLNIDETLPGMETSTIDSSKIATTSNQSPITPTVQRSVPAGLLKPASQSTPAIPCTQQSNLLVLPHYPLSHQSQYQLISLMRCLPKAPQCQIMPRTWYFQSLIKLSS